MLVNNFVTKFHEDTFNKFQVKELTQFVTNGQTYGHNPMLFSDVKKVGNTD